MDVKTFWLERSNDFRESLPPVESPGRNLVSLPSSADNHLISRAIGTSVVPNEDLARDATAILREVNTLFDCFLTEKSRRPCLPANWVVADIVRPEDGRLPVQR
jgi:hypothetical protein